MPWVYVSATSLREHKRGGPSSRKRSSERMEAYRAKFGDGKGAATLRQQDWRSGYTTNFDQHWSSDYGGWMWCDHIADDRQWYSDGQSWTAADSDG